MTRLTSTPQLLWKNTLPFIYWDNFFTEHDLQKIENYCESIGTEKSTIVSSFNTNVDRDIRNSEIKLHYVNKNNEWIFDKLLTVAELINDNFYRFDLLGFDHFQYTEYNNAGAKYDFHTDMLFGTNIPQGMDLCRKLSFSLILSDKDTYQGGDFQLNLASDSLSTLDQCRGRIIAFPSYILHRVTPIIKGNRKSIVFWALGPKFK